MLDPSAILQMALRFFGFLIPLFMVAPWLSAWFMHRGFGRAKIAGPPLKQCIQACFFASSVTLVVVFGTIIPLRILKSPAGESFYLFFALYLGSQLLFVPIFLRDFSPRTVLIVEGGVVLANAIVIVLLYLLFS